MGHRKVLKVGDFFYSTVVSKPRVVVVHGVPKRRTSTTFKVTLRKFRLKVKN